jgi:hypothetical protein
MRRHKRGIENPLGKPYYTSRIRVSACNENEAKKIYHAKFNKGSGTTVWKVSKLGDSTYQLHLKTKLKNRALGSVKVI